jgi:hypothetical protein
MREVGHLELRSVQLRALSQHIRPLSMPANAGIEPFVLHLLCERLYRALLELDMARSESVQVSVTTQDVMLIHQFVCEEDGNFMDDVLRQCREVLYESHTGTAPVYRTDPAALAALWQEGDLPELDPDKV